MFTLCILICNNIWTIWAHIFVLHMELGIFLKNKLLASYSNNEVTKHFTRVAHWRPLDVYSLLVQYVNWWTCKLRTTNCSLWRHFLLMDGSPASREGCRTISSSYGAQRSGQRRSAAYWIIACSMSLCWMAAIRRFRHDYRPLKCFRFSALQDPRLIVNAIIAPGTDLFNDTSFRPLKFKPDRERDPGCRTGLWMCRSRSTRNQPRHVVSRQQSTHRLIEHSPR